MTVAPRAGLIGLLGQGNLGTDGPLETVLAYLDAEDPDAILNFLRTGTDQMMARYGVPATRLRWYNTQTQRAPGVTALAAKSLMVPLGMIVDAFRIGTWVRRHDVVMVPGMGVLETSLSLRSWHTPYSMFLVSAFGRAFGTKVALVSVGANDIRQPLARRLVIAAARLAYYRSFRALSQGTRCDEWASTHQEMLPIPDLAFALPIPRDVPVVAGMVGVGVMDYHGSNDDRRQADQLHASYVEKMKSFVLWLVDNGRSVRLFTADVLAKPTLSVSYAAKFGVLMAEVGMAEFCQTAHSVDADRLIEQFTELESRSAQLQQMIMERTAANARLLNHQFATLSALLFRSSEPEKAAAGDKRARIDILKE